MCTAKRAASVLEDVHAVGSLSSPVYSVPATKQACPRKSEATGRSRTWQNLGEWRNLRFANAEMGQLLLQLALSDPLDFTAAVRKENLAAIPTSLPRTCLTQGPHIEHTLADERSHSVSWCKCFARAANETRGRYSSIFAQFSRVHRSDSKLIFLAP